ncbi:MAG: hypothetical protein ACFE8E_06450 [Candidatus Hodarchaeota archaeon]
MLKTKGLAIIFILFLIIGIIHGFIITFSLNIFFTWPLIGLWVIFTLKILENVKRHREFNSPYNTAFFVVIPLFIGIFYSIWGYFTGILGQNLIEGSSLYFSWWSIIFGFPFVLYGSYSLYRCFKKYNVIYFGTKSINARRLGYILAFIVVLFIMIYWIAFYSVNVFYDSPLTPLHFSLNLNLLILLITTLLILIIFGFVGSKQSLPTLTREYITQRTRRLNSLTSPSTLNSSRRRNTSSRPNPSTRTTTRTTIRRTPTTVRETTRTKTKTSTQTKRVKAHDFSRYKPKASYLSVEDFKCIFCFKLPKLPDDRGRGVVICPKCRYPAHADEFRDWMQTSNLCSRCSAPISSSYRRNPRIISVKNYLMIYSHFLKKKS